MNDYRLYRLDGDGRISFAQPIAADDDDDAIRQAREMGSNAVKCELWRGRELIIALSAATLRSEAPPGNRP